MEHEQKDLQQQQQQQLIHFTATAAFHGPKLSP
jgi:hypothetical protein